MKTNKLLFLVFFLFILSSCETNISVFTKGNKDGSIVKTYTIVNNKNVSKDISELIPLAIDSSWKTSNFNISDSTIAIQVSKKFKCDEDLNKNLKFDDNKSWKNVLFNVQYIKKFKFFYTSYYYKEQFYKVENNYPSPLNYMSENEAKFVFTGKPDLTQNMNGLEMSKFFENSDIPNAIDKWVSSCIIFDYGNIILNHLINMNIIKDNQISDIHNCIIDYANSVCLNTTIDSVHKLILESEDFLGSLAQVIDNHINISESFKYIQSDEFNDDMDEYYKTNITILDPYKFDCSLLLPGNLISSNTNVISGDTLYWSLDASRLLYNDVIMEAQTRQFNGIVIIFTILIILFLILIIFRTKK